MVARRGHAWCGTPLKARDDRGTVSAVSVPGASLDVQAPGWDALPRPVADWVAWSAQAVADWLGTFPVPRATLKLHVEPGAGVRFGLAGAGGHDGEPPVLDVWLGADTTPRHLDDDWVLVHEMLHLALPGLEARHRWFKEGLAVYVEPQVRAAAGRVELAEVWRGLARGMERGEPSPSDRGLDDARSWARVYWGGAAWACTADVALREATGGRAGLVDAQRGIVAAGATLGARRTLADVLAAGDAATGTSVLRDLYAAFAPLPRRFDVPDLMERATRAGIRPG